MKKLIIPLAVVVFILLSGCLENNGGLASVATACFRALDAEVANDPVPYFPYISLEGSNLDTWGNTVVAPYEFTMYRYWTNERLNSAGFKGTVAFRTNPVWTSDTLDLAAIIPVFSDESRRLFYKDSGYIDDPVDLTILDEGNYYSNRESFLTKLAPEPEDGGGGPAASKELSSSCQPLQDMDSERLYPVAIKSGDEADTEWTEDTYPFRNVMSLFSGYHDEYLKLYDTYVLAYDTDHSGLMNIAVHLYSKNLQVVRVWMKTNEQEIELKKSTYLNTEEMNTENWTLYDAEVSAGWFGQNTAAAQVFVELKGGEIKELHNM
ncbi:hypothetical protein P4H42_09370 [Paenibacillus macerans]|uniref:hypothetical protein n=1 Tax=Paenibacillus macerans TaxID=44252 RepID=UPI002DBD74F8|nr:hypothetical protein [Paenibacillus macerans]MEC0329826.1 hypothetical protein [Paenibacillus macerans]